MVNYLLFDVETTGLPLKYNASYEYLENWPRIVQISWCVCDHTGMGDNIEERIKDYIIKPNDFIIPDKSTEIHGITHDMAMEKGIALSVVISEFKRDVEKCNYIVAHNLSFDRQVLLSELVRLSDIKGIDQVKQLTQICTKDETVKYCKLRPFRYGSWKWPKLCELYYILSSCIMDEDKAHNSKYDVEILTKCFFMLLDKGLIKSCDTTKLRSGRVLQNQNNFELKIT